MKKLKFLNKYVGTTFAMFALVVAQVASTRFSVIFYQDEIPEKLKRFEKQDEIKEK
ncbi:MAG: cyclic lactone autoinducer peptide [Bacillota bacterium]|nr:cyclic lactone autoinducer peptide [Bacillota bacterium]